MSGRYAALSAALVALSLLIASLAPVAQGASGGIPGAPSSRPTQKPKPTPSPTPTSGSYLEGLDVSVYQSTIDWAKVAAAGKKFAIIRASAGSLTADTRYAANRSGAKAAGLPIAAYHFANPDTAPNDALNEANWFLQNATPTHGEMIPALDVEVTNGLSVSAMQTWVSTWLTRVSSVLGVKPMIYTSPNFWSTYMGNTTQFADGGYKILWIAHWTSASQPTVPANNWGGNGWTFWQYTSSGTVSGISGNVDLDRYNGTTLASSLFIP
jgi:GH25 family lysozyme M1 (1,4-beta-N-acetylmuramidase)